MFSILIFKNVFLMKTTLDRKKNQKQTMKTSAKHFMCM